MARQMGMELRQKAQKEMFRQAVDKCTTPSREMVSVIGGGEVSQTDDTRAVIDSATGPSLSIAQFQVIL